MTAIRGDIHPPRWSESKQLWIAEIDLGVGPDGRRNRIACTSRNRDTAIAKRRAKLMEIEDGTYIPGQKPKVSVWMHHWCDTIAHERVKPRVLANYRSYLKVHVRPAIGERRLDRLTVDDVRHLHAVMREGGASDRTVQAVHATLAKCLKDAVREGIIRDNPCDRMDRPRARMEPRGAFSRVEAQAILTTARGDGPKLYSRWLAALVLGGRQAELLGLEWDRVDLDRGLADLSWQIQRIPWRHGHGCACGDGVSASRCRHREPDVPSWMDLRHAHGGIWFTPPKTSASVRVVPLPSPLVDALREWRDVSPATTLGLVWPDGSGKPENPKADGAVWKELCVRAGVRPLTLHSTRHTMVTLLLEAGVSPEVIRQLAGHSTILSTRNYMHLGQDAARQALSVLGGYAPQ